ncbi:MAG: GGDEF domain-containing protein [Spirochaetales bacterium]|nr:GGDEF domain-containing protein [Spirochaetales bacterium]
MEEKVRLLKNAKLFSRLKDSDIATIAEYSEFRDYDDDAVIFEEGTFGESLFIVKQGAVRIIKREEGKKDRDIARFIPGDLFGDLDLFEDSPRTATALAEEDTTLLIFPAPYIQFTELINKYPDIFARVLHVLLATVAGRIRSTNKLLSDKTQWIDDLRKQILYDKLTGLYNKSWLKEDFPLQLPSYGNNTTVLVLKPDNFKYINDTYGHSAGDRVLQIMSETLKNSTRKTDTVIRYRGDEFVVILPNTTTDDGLRIAENLRQKLYAINIKKVIMGDEFRTPWSIGVGTYPVHADDHNEIIKVTFDIMLSKRNSGGDGVKIAP